MQEDRITLQFDIKPEEEGTMKKQKQKIITELNLKSLKNG